MSVNKKGTLRRDSFNGTITKSERGNSIIREQRNVKKDLLNLKKIVNFSIKLNYNYKFCTMNKFFKLRFNFSHT